jgi:hypothetical protein
MAHPDIAASMARSMKIEAKTTKSAESATTADEGADTGTASEETSGESSSEEGGEDGADTDTGSDADEGNEGGESDSQDTESDDTTAEGEESDADPEEQASGEDGEESEDDESEDEKPDAPKWDEDEQKAVKDWFGKEADKVKPDPVVKKLVKIARDNQAKAQDGTQQVAALNGHIAGLGELILNQDFDGLNAIAEELGGEKLPFDTRKPEDRMKEVAAEYNSVFDTLEKGLKDQPEVWKAVVAALDPVYQKTTEQIGKFKEEMLLNKAREEGRKAGGKPVKGSITNELKAKSTANFTDLKAKDPEAQARFEALKPFFNAGILRDKDRIYALSPKVADELGKAVEFQTNFAKKYLPKIREALKEELKAQRALKAPPSSRKPEGERPSGGKPAAQPNKNFNAFAGKKILEKLRG